MSKVPCGGFNLDENFLGMNENNELSLTGGSEGKAYQYLVTDGDGTAKWEDRLAYDDSKVVVDAGEGRQFVKVADEVPSWASVDSSMKVWVSNGTIGTVPPEGNTDLSNGSFVVDSSVVITTTDNLEFNRIVFPEKGVYFAYSPEQYITGIASADSDTPEITWDGNIGEIKKIDEKYLPDTIATKLDVEVAYTEALAAQTAADKNKETLSQMLTYVLTFAFDKQTSGRDTFEFNAYNYYKISDFNPSPDDVISFTGTRESGVNLSTITTGKNCVEYGFFIVVASAGVCSLPITETVTGSFTAPSAGLYARYDEGNTSMTAGTGKFTLRVTDGSLSGTGLLLKSSTANSTKQFKITVDDNGTLTATEVTS